MFGNTQTILQFLCDCTIIALFTTSYFSDNYFNSYKTATEHEACSRCNGSQAATMAADTSPMPNFEERRD